MNILAKSFNLERPEEGQRIIALCENDVTILTYMPEFFSRVSCMSGHKPTHWIPFPTLPDSSFLSANQVASYFLCKSRDSEKDLHRYHKVGLNTLQLVNLVYIAQGISLAVNNKPLFEEEIKDWKCGPVVESVFKEYEKYNRSPIHTEHIVEIQIYDKNSVKIMDKVWESFGKWPQEKLTNWCKEKGSPWDKVYDMYNSNVITKESIKSYFEKYVTIMPTAVAETAFK